MIVSIDWISVPLIRKRVSVDGKFPGINPWLIIDRHEPSGWCKIRGFLKWARQYQNRPARRFSPSRCSASPLQQQLRRGEPTGKLPFFNQGAVAAVTVRGCWGKAFMREMVWNSLEYLQPPKLEMTFHDSPGVCVVSVQAAKTTSCFSGLFKHQDPAAKLHQNRPLKPPVFTNKIVVPGGWQSQQIMRKCCRKPTHLFLPKSNLCSRSTAARSANRWWSK